MNHHQDRFLKYVHEDDLTSCWLWTGATNLKGYGRFALDGRNWIASRAAWVIFVGPIPDGHEIDHDDPERGCHNRSCVNPDHLVVVVGEVNKRRKKRNNSTGHVNVRWDSLRQRYVVQLRHAGKTHFGGRFRGDPPPASPPQEAVWAAVRLRETVLGAGA